MKIIEIVNNWNKSEECFYDIQKLIQSKKFNEMLETWSDFSKDFTHGNSFDFGDFDKCLSLTFANIQPQHCLIQYEYKPTSNHTIILVPPKVTFLNYNLKHMDKRFVGSICIPKSCTAGNVREIMKEMFKESEFIQTQDYDQSDYCLHKNKSFKFDELRIISIVCLIILPMLVIIGTILTNLRSTSTTIKIFQCFSLLTNFKTFKDFSTTKSTITCINGMKALSTITIFFFHSFLIRISFAFSDGKILYVLFNENSLTYGISCFVIALDSFFIISGVLIGRSLINSKNLNFWKFFVQRYMRLTFLTLFLICYNAVSYSLAKLEPKPYMHLDFAIIDDCKENWWTTVLNIQTFVNPKHMCVGQSWYAAVLFNLIISAAIIHMILEKINKSTAFLCHAMILFCGFLIHFYVFITRETFLGENLGRVNDISEDILKNSYYSITTRIFPFFSGIFLAHLLDDSNNFVLFKNEKIKNVFIKTLYFLSIGFYFSIIYILFFIITGRFTKFYAILINIFWIVTTNILIYACHKGFGGMTNYFFSMKIWIPISKMALTIYLVAPCYQGISTLIRTTPFDKLTGIGLIYGFFFDVLIVALPVLIIYLSVECSILNLSNLITGKNQEKLKN
ncbi:hypothetical protein PVAND_005257 [Polypedilum vanderplanki]|uniref:Nose resistant-to-fluoxetine protein N-terminal domain-containing protein n=1 Tax=Polypedilum vanderplanki TaxID=319348 RepID=A0A9J6C0K5_POLVA|nr:hypothetical protein PVAND_005257 [Polypedilum vanderplanki]